jgi:hypothetical protein
MALGEQRGTTEMFVHSDHSPSSSILPTTLLSTQLYPFTGRQQQVSICVETLDAVFDDLRLDVEPELLVKLDVQGYEGRVIRGGRQVLSGASACIVEISLETLYEGQSTFKEIFLELDSLGFSYAGNFSQAYAADSRVVYIDAVFMRRGSKAAQAVRDGRDTRGTGNV